MKKFILIFFLTFGTTLLIAQEQTSNWFFGQNAGLSFTSGIPIPLLEGSLNTMEGSTSISSLTGELLFYTDGMSVWNRDHFQMPNGNGLLGDPSSSQSGIIVPKPNSDNLYYIFTVDDVANGSSGLNGINYSLVDMKLQGLKGDVVDTVKNINLSSPMCEKVTAVWHANGFDTWVISQKWGTNHIYAYLVTEEGVNHTPVISEVGQVIGGPGVDIDVAKGYMKVSPNGELIVKANAGLHSVEIFDFNDQTGEVSNPMIIPSLPGEPYGVEFSPDGKLLYVNTWKSNPQKKLFQYNLESGNIDDILASEFEVASGTEGTLQIAPDERIYVAMRNSGSLSCINSPNGMGADCDFEWASISLGGRTCSWGLPNFMQSFFETLTDIEEPEVTMIAIDVFPNPNKGIFNIIFNENVSNPEIIILNLNGQIIHEQKFANNYLIGEKVDMRIDSPNEGIYLIKIISENRYYICKLLIR